MAANKKAPANGKGDDKAALMKRLHAWAELVYEWHRFRELILEASENGALERRGANEACDTMNEVHCSLTDGMPVK